MSWINVVAKSSDNHHVGHARWFVQPAITLRSLSEGAPSIDAGCAALIEQRPHATPERSVVPAILHSTARAT